jgi:hypothetical protein
MMELFRTTMDMAERVAIVDDTNLSLTMLSVVLENLGVPNDVEVIVPRNPHVRGVDFWSELIEHGRIKPETHLHIGSDRLKDEQNPGRLGIAALGVLGPADRWRMKTGGTWSSQLPNGPERGEWLRLGEQVSDFGSQAFDH